MFDQESLQEYLGDVQMQAHRNAIAKLAMQSLILRVDHRTRPPDPKLTAKLAHEYADAMLYVREHGPYPPEG